MNSGLLFILDITLADIRVYVKSSLGIDGNSFPRRLDCLSIQLSIDNAFLLIQFTKNFSVWVDDQTVAPGIVVGSHVSSRRTETNVDLVIHGSCTCL